MQLQVKSLVDVIIGFGNPFEDDCPEQLHCMMRLIEAQGKASIRMMWQFHSPNQKTKSEPAHAAQLSNTKVSLVAC